MKTLWDRDVLLHLRVPFSFYLFPVFLFGISQVQNIDATKAVVVFVALHIFIYPASNIYNSYMDKDEGSIGGLEHPPPVTRSMYYASIVFDVAGLLICLFAGWKNMLIMSGYILFSKLYSWTGLRLKRHPIVGWLSVLFFQGGYTFMLSNMAASNDNSAAWFTRQHLECMLIASLMLAGSYPLTQIYQHEEDGRRGDYTISYKLGVRGTFILSSIFFAAVAAIVFHYFMRYYSAMQFYVFAGCLLPVVIYFSSWMIRCWRDASQADYRHAMMMNRISATCMIVCFSIILWLNQSALHVA